MKLKIILSRYLFALAWVLSMVSCQPKTGEDTKATAQEHNEAKFDEAEARDASFLIDAAEINLEEIKLGQLANKNGMVSDIQALGKSITEDHTKVLSSLRRLAAKKMISIPDSLTQKGKDSYKNLLAQPGKDFDRAFCGLMVENHKNAIDKFELAAADVNDTDIKAWATAALPALRHHLDQAMECQKKFDAKH